MTRLRLFFICLACLLLAACGTPTEIAQVQITDTPVLPTATATALPVTNTAVPTTMAATASPTETATPLPTNTPTATPVPLPPPTGRIYFFWDPTPFNNAGVPSTSPKRNLYIAAPGNTASEWHIQTLLDQGMDWSQEAPWSPEATLSPDLTKLAITVWKDANGDGDIHSVQGGDLTAIYVYGLPDQKPTRLTDYSSLSFFSLSWLPDNQSLAYSWGKEVYTVDINNSLSQAITPSFSHNIETVMTSPDGQLIAVVSNGNLFFFDWKTTDITPVLTNGQINHGNMAWDPNSQWFVTNENSSMGLLAIDTRTYEVFSLVESGVFSYPTWAQDGSRLSFTRGGVNNPGLFLWDPNTQQTTQIYDHLVFPVWSADSTKLAVSFVQDTTTNVAIVDVITGEIQRLLQAPDTEIFTVLTWSPDSLWILFLVEKEETLGLYVLNQENSSTYLIFEFPKDSVRPDFFFWLPE